MGRSKKIKKMINVLLALLLIGSISGNIVLASSYGSVKRNEKNLSKTVKEIEQDYKELQEFNKEELEKVCDMYYENRLRNIMDKDDLEYLAFMAWEYNITINGNEVKSPIVYTRSDTVKITFTEAKIEDNLPKNIMKEGKFVLSEENLKDYVTTEFHGQVEVYTNEEDGNRIITYTFRDIKVGDVITLRLKKALIDRMMLYEKINLQDDNIQIIRKE